MTPFLASAEHARQTLDRLVRAVAPCCMCFALSVLDVGVSDLREPSHSAQLEHASVNGRVLKLTLDVQMSEIIKNNVVEVPQAHANRGNTLILDQYVELGFPRFSFSSFCRNAF